MAEGIRVFTETICGKCGKTNMRDGAEGECPPVDWAKLYLNIREEGSGWTNSKNLGIIICPKCVEKALEEFFIEEIN